MNCRGYLQIQKFFCCCSLRLGSLIIGYLGLVGNVLQATGGAAHLTYINSQNNIEFFRNATNTTTTVFEYTEIYNEFAAVVIVYHVLSALFYLALLWGVHKNKHELILPWLIVKGIEYVVVTIIAFALIVLYCTILEMDIGLICVLIATLILSTWLSLYLYACVYSYYLLLKAQPIQQTQESNLPPAYIKTFNDNKKENIAKITISQNVI